VQHEGEDCGEPRRRRRRMEKKLKIVLKKLQRRRQVVTRMRKKPKEKRAPSVLVLVKEMVKEKGKGNETRKERQVWLGEGTVDGES